MCFRLLYSALFFILILSHSSITGAVTEKPILPDLKITETILKNGLKVIILEDHKSPVVTFQIWYRVGSVDEPKGKTGISHLLEHMMFKGTSMAESKEFSRLIQKMGGIDNAYTTRDYTAYFQLLPSNSLDLPLRFESDRMRNLLLDPHDLDYERSVVMEERRMRYEDDPEASLYETLLLTAFSAHSYRTPVIGFMSDLKSITRDDILNHYINFYSPENAFIIVAGDVKSDSIISEIKKYFEHIESSFIKKNTDITEEPQQRGEKRVYLKKNAELPYIIMSFKAPSFPEPDAIALDLLSTILSGKSGRLYRRLIIEEELAVSVDASFSSLNRYPFLFFIDAVPKMGVDAERVEKAIIEVLEEIKRDGVTHREMEKAKNQLLSSLIMSIDSVYSMARLLGSFEILGNWRLLYKYMEMVMSLKKEDIQIAMKRYLNDDFRTTGILVPVKAVR